MSLEDDLDSLRLALAAASDTRAQDWYPVYKARYGMQVVFRALGTTAGRGQVLTQALTCCTAVDPILAAGLAPSYGDIDGASLSLPPEVVEAGHDAVVMQHTFGLIDRERSAALAARARRLGAVVVEDSAHCVGRLAVQGPAPSGDQADRGPGQEPLADVSIHSFGVQKILPTHFGGAVWISPGLVRTRPDFDRRVRQALGSLPALSARLDWASRGYRTQARILARLPHRFGSSLRTGAARAGVLEPPVSALEQRGGLPLAPMLPSSWVARRATAALSGLPALYERLAATAEVLRRGPRGGLVVPASVLDGPAQPLMRVPVLADGPDRADALIARLRSAGVYAEPWGRPLLYPGVADPRSYRLPATASLPVTAEVSATIVAVPTDLGPDQVERCLQILRS